MTDRRIGLLNERVNGSVPIGAVAGAVVRHLRELYGFGSREFAAKAKIPQSNLSAVENGRMLATVSHLARVDAALLELNTGYRRGQVYGLLVRLEVSLRAAGVEVTHRRVARSEHDQHVAAWRDILDAQLAIWSADEELDLLAGSERVVAEAAGLAVRRLRARGSMSVAELAGRMEPPISQPMLSQLELGQRGLGLERLLQVDRALHKAGQTREAGEVFLLLHALVRAAVETENENDRQYASRLVDRVLGPDC